MYAVWWWWQNSSYLYCKKTYACAGTCSICITLVPCWGVFEMGMRDLDVAFIPNKNVRGGIFIIVVLVLE